MICTYEYKNDIIFLTFPETLSDNDFLLINKEIEIIEQKYSALPHFIVNLKNVNTFNGDYQSIQELATSRKAKKFPNHILEAIVVSNNFQMGFARMYQTCNDNPQLTIKIFQEETKAVEWIKTGGSSS